jgi:hypothetical protein
MYQALANVSDFCRKATSNKKVGNREAENCIE